MPVDDFEGFSPADMRYILYDPFSTDSPVSIRKDIPGEILDKMPLFRQIEYLLNLIYMQGELKLTAKGFLPTNVVKDIYYLGLMPDEMIDRGITKLYAETSCDNISLTRIITELSGFTKKKHNKLSLTAAWKGKLIKGERQAFFNQAFATFSQKFFWGYFDGYESQSTGQLGFAFSMFLLHRYGGEEREDSFYSGKYLKAFPVILSEFKEHPYRISPEKGFHSCYSIRTFDRFLEYFNLVELRITGDKYFDEKKFVRKSRLFDDIFSFEY